MLQAPTQCFVAFCALQKVVRVAPSKVTRTTVLFFQVGTLLLFYTAVVHHLRYTLNDSRIL